MPALILPRVFLAVALGCFAGCSAPSQPLRMEVHPVSGTLLVNGHPAANAMVAFHPLASSGTQAVCPVAVTGPDGTFRVMTYQPGDGAPAGEYAVTAVWPDLSLPVDECVAALAHDRLNGRYADPVRSPLRVAVEPGANNIPLQLRSNGGWSRPRLRDIEGK